MKLYAINYYDREQKTDRVAWAGTQASAKTKRKELIEKNDSHNVEVVQDVDVPTHKSGLLAWLNTHATEGPL